MRSKRQPTGTEPLSAFSSSWVPNPMPITPSDWSVVIVGHWNRAILTPSGIVRRLLRLPEQTPVEVEVALDAFLPYRVRHDNVVITAGSDKLLVQPTSFNYRAFEAALATARAGIAELPETPVYAAGFNLNFKTGEYAEALTPITGHPWDDRLSDEDFDIETRSTTRVLRWRGGLIRAAVMQEADMSFVILLNYERLSTSVPELIEWLSIPVQDIRAATERILSRCLDLALEDIRYGN